MGHACGFRAIKVDRNRPTEFSHVYSIVQTNGSRWKAADASDKKFALGAVPEKRGTLVGAKMWQVHSETGQAIPMKVTT
jgi:hypothetical protein